MSPDAKTLPEKSGKETAMQRLRIVAVVALFLFMLGGIATAAMREYGKRPVKPSLPATSGDGTGPVAVYYFHGFQRCAGCLRTEKMLREVLEEAFPAEMKAGTVVFRAVNVEEIENVDIVERFSVTARHPVVADERRGPNGPWKEIARIPGEKEELRKVVEPLVRSMLQGEAGESR